MASGYYSSLLGGDISNYWGTTGATGATGNFGATGATGASGTGYIPSTYFTQGTAVGQIVLPSTNTIIQFTAEYDPQSWFTDLSNNRFKPNIAGYYIITLTCLWGSINNAGLMLLYLRVNNVSVSTNQFYVDTIYDYGTQQVTKLVYLNGTTDYVDFLAYTYSTANQTLYAGATNSYFTATLQMAGAATGATGSTGSTGSTGATGPSGIGLSGTNYGDNIYWTGTTWAVSDTFVAIGGLAGQTGQGTNAVAIGYRAGQTGQGTNAIAIGYNAGQTAQGTNSVAIGTQAGAYTQGLQSIAIGYTAGQLSQGLNSVAIGLTAGNNIQDINAVAIGNSCGQNTQGAFAVAVGCQAGMYNQGRGAVAVGYGSGLYTQGTNSIAIGLSAGYNGQGTDSIAIGNNAGQYLQASGSIAIGYYAGTSNQKLNSIAIGYNAGRTAQGTNNIAIGYGAGYLNQAANNIAIGYGAGGTNQLGNGVAIGVNAGAYSQGNGSIAIGWGASVTNQAANSICISAGHILSPLSPGVYIYPIRTASAITSGANLCVMLYNANTAEITWSTSGDQLSSKTFVIDHPVKKENYLVHSCLEGPEAGVYYRGKEFVEFEIEIKLPEYTEALATDFTVHVTPIGKFAELYCSEVEHCKFTVYSNKPCKFNWIVYAKRADINVEPLKADTKIHGEGPYRWI